MVSKPEITPTSNFHHARDSTYVEFDRHCYDGWPVPNTLDRIADLTGILFLAREGNVLIRCSAIILSPNTIASAAYCLKGWQNGKIYAYGTDWQLYFAGGYARNEAHVDLRHLLQTPSSLDGYYHRVVEIRHSDFYDWQNMPDAGIDPAYEPTILEVSRGIQLNTGGVEEYEAPRQFQSIVISSLSLFAMRLAQLTARLDGRRQPIHADFLSRGAWRRLIRSDTSPLCIVGAVSQDNIPTLGHDCQTNQGSSGSLMFLRSDDMLSAVGLHVSAPGRQYNDPPENQGPNNLGTSLNDTARSFVGQ